MQADAADTGATGYQADRDRGTNAAVNRMGTFPQTTRRWWRKEFKALRPRHLDEVRAETEAAYRMAAERGQRVQKGRGGSSLARAPASKL